MPNALLAYLSYLLPAVLLDCLCRGRVTSRLPPWSLSALTLDASALPASYDVISTRSATDAGQTRPLRKQT